MPQHRELSNPPELHPAPGFSHVAVASGTPVVHLAGQVALDQQTITAAIDEVTGGAEHPPQTIVGVTGLAVPGLLIEVECTAVRAH